MSASYLTKSRLEAFSDGVIAIIITIMVLEIHVPAGHDLPDLVPVLPTLFGYLLSFVFVGIYWNNHHHLLQAVHRVNGAILWANNHPLFWLSLVPFVTSWMGENHNAAFPTAAYGFVLIMAAVSYTILQSTILATLGKDSELARAVGRDWKGKTSIGCYLAALGLAFVSPWLSYVLYLTVAVMWFIPDRRIEKHVHHA